MITLRAAKETLANTKVITDAYFLKLHIAVAYMLKRFFFSGLRLHDVQYKT